MPSIITRRGLIKASPAAALSVGAIAGFSEAAKAQANAMEVIQFHWFRPAAAPFVTSSQVFVKTNMPLNPTFTKMYADTYVWGMCSIDVSAPAGCTTGNAIAYNGVNELQVAMPSNGATTVPHMEDIFGHIPIGPGDWSVYVAVLGGVGPVTWDMRYCTYKLLEICLPTADYSELKDRFRESRRPRTFV